MASRSANPSSQVDLDGQNVPAPPTRPIYANLFPSFLVPAAGPCLPRGCSAVAWGLFKKSSSALYPQVLHKQQRASDLKPRANRWTPRARASQLIATLAPFALHALAMRHLWQTSYDPIKAPFEHFDTKPTPSSSNYIPLTPIAPQKTSQLMVFVLSVVH